MALPIDRKGSVGFFDVERFVVAVTGKPQREVIVAVDDPCVAGFGGEQRQLTDGDDAPIMGGGTADDIANFVGKTQACTLDDAGRVWLRAGPFAALWGLPWTRASSCSATSWSLSIIASTALSF